MGKSPKVPAAPDPVKTAQAQGQANVDAAKLETELNRYDQKTPFGSSTWSRDPADPNKWTNSYQLSPELQGMLGSVYQSMGQPGKQVDMGALPAAPTGQAPTQTGLGLSEQQYRDQQNTGIQAGLGSMQNSANALGASAGSMDGRIAQSNTTATNSGTLANSQIDRLRELYGQDFNYDKLGAMPTASDATRKAVEDAYYKKATSRLDPQYANYEAEMRSRLANQGITEGSEAYNRELQEMMRGRTDAYGQATNDAILNSTTEMGKQFAMELAGRQQGVSEQNYIRELGTKEAQAAMGLYDQSSGIASGDRLTQSQLLKDEAGMYQAMEGLKGAAGDRAAQAQGMDLASKGLDLQQSNNNLQWQAQQGANRGNAFNEQLALSNLDSGQRTQMINSLMSLMSGSQMQAPGAVQTQVGAAPVAQSIYNSYQGQVDAANSKAQANQGMWGSLGSLGMLGYGLFGK